MVKRELVLTCRASADAIWWEQFKKGLNPSVHSVDITDGWPTSGPEMLARSRVVVLLVSPHFMVSDLFTDFVQSGRLEEAQRQGVQVFWIPLRASVAAQTLIGQYKAAWDPGHPLAELPVDQASVAWGQVCKEIEHAFAREVGPLPPKSELIPGLLHPRARSQRLIGFPLLLAATLIGLAGYLGFVILKIARPVRQPPRGQSAALVTGTAAGPNANLVQKPMAAMSNPPSRRMVPDGGSVDARR